jgi:spermidine synthase
MKAETHDADVTLPSGREVLARVETSYGELQLQRRAAPEARGQAAYEIILNGVFLMASYNQSSATALGRLALEPLLGDDRPLRVLVGGLGMGFTLQAVLAYPQVSAVDVVEIDSHVIAWNYTYFGELNGDALRDPRTHLIRADLADHLAGDPGPYDAMALDTDNGPDWLALEQNARLYNETALRRMQALLKPGGVLALWGASPAPEFQARLRAILSSAELLRVVESGPRGEPTDYFIHRARKEWESGK